MLNVGLTGGIGSGKTTVADRFKRFNVPFIDADVITRELVVPGSPALASIVQRFGETVLHQSGELDRRQLREIVFHDPRAKKDLEAILHPGVHKEIAERLAGISAPYGLAVVPLLVETGMSDLFDRIIVVDCDEAEQIKRVMHRDACSEQHAQAVLLTQANRAARLAIATDVIHNGADLAQLDLAVKRLHYRLLELAGKAS